jgi:hypothetical protein
MPSLTDIELEFAKQEWRDYCSIEKERNRSIYSIPEKQLQEEYEEYQKERYNDPTRETTKKNILDLPHNHGGFSNEYECTR